VLFLHCSDSKLAVTALRRSVPFGVCNMKPLAAARDGLILLLTALHTLSIVEEFEDLEVAVERVYDITRNSLEGSWSAWIPASEENLDALMCVLYYSWAYSSRVWSDLEKVYCETYFVMGQSAPVA